MFRFPLCLLVVYDLFLFIQGNMLGPADLIFKRFEYCEPKTTIVDIFIEPKKFNRTTEVLDITIRTPFPIDENVILELQGSMKKEGGYKQGSFYYKDVACVALYKMLGDMFHDILHMAGAESCPLSEGDYEVKNFFFDNKKFDVPQIWGEYKMEASLFKEEELQGCYVIYYDMVAKDVV